MANNSDDTLFGFLTYYGQKNHLMPRYRQCVAVGGNLTVHDTII